MIFYLPGKRIDENKYWCPLMGKIVKKTKKVSCYSASLFIVFPIKIFPIKNIIGRSLYLLEKKIQRS